MHHEIIWYLELWIHTNTHACAGARYGVSSFLLKWLLGSLLSFFTDNLEERITAYNIINVEAMHINMHVHLLDKHQINRDVLKMFSG